MGPAEPEFTVGVEEEYLLVDRETRALVVDPPQSVVSECQALVGDQVSAELQRSQIEIGTRVCNDMHEVRAELQRLRKVVVDVAGNHGLAPIAASTHPFSHWSDQKHTAHERYDSLITEMQAAARRLVICGMHVHVGISDPELRIDLMNQVSYFLPHLLAMSCSSPFWGGADTGFKSYRLTVFDALPRTGIPEHFYSFAEYQRHVDMLIGAGLIEDSTKIWWDLRPSGRYPTLETRVMDVCTYLDDAVALTALLVCLLRMLYRLRISNQRWRNYNAMLINENRWRAMRYSYDEGLVDLGRGRITGFSKLLREAMELVAEDAEALGYSDEIEALPGILERGTSAHRQLEAYRLAREDGGDHEDSLKAVVDQLVADTSAGLEAGP